jgi:hypothetical protein
MATGVTNVAMVRASCGSCGDIEFRSGDAQVRISSPDGSGTYTYCCPSCQGIRQVPAPASAIKLLLDAGCVQLPSELPAELEEHDPTAPLLTHDDLLAFHALLETDDWMDLLVED